MRLPGHEKKISDPFPAPQRETLRPLFSSIEGRRGENFEVGDDLHPNHHATSINSGPMSVVRSEISRMRCDKKYMKRIIEITATIKMK